jgi:FkbM family methyltransferase
MVTLSPALPPPRSLRALSALTRLLPAFPHASGISNRLVKPLWCMSHSGRYRMKVWDDLEMILDPADGIGGNLVFIPQLFDHWERATIRRLLPVGGTFVDIGANVGSYTLWAARQVGPTGTVLAYEAEPFNFASLVENIAINGFSNVQTFQVGVSDKVETLPLHLNPRGNSGGNSFLDDVHARASDRTVNVACEPLASLLDAAGVRRVDWMKLDIEGFEDRVLSRFFRDVSPSSPLCPTYILTEFFSGDVPPPGSLQDTLAAAGYKLLEQRMTKAHNALFARTR